MKKLSKANLIAAVAFIAATIVTISTRNVRW